MVNLKEVNSESKSKSNSSVYSSMFTAIPQDTRNRVSKAVFKVYGWGLSGLTSVGNWLWIITTSTLILVFPARRAIEIEQAMLEQESSQRGISGGPMGNEVPIIMNDKQ
jgi:hypothetical protein